MKRLHFTICILIFAGLIYAAWYFYSYKKYCDGFGKAAGVITKYNIFKNGCEVKS